MSKPRGASPPLPQVALQVRQIRTAGGFEEEEEEEEEEGEGWALCPAESPPPRLAELLPGLACATSFLVIIRVFIIFKIVLICLTFYVH